LDLEVAKSIPEHGLRQGLTARDIADPLWALASSEMYELLTVLGDYSPAAFQSRLQ
jgi:hypothetical protein